MNKIIEKLTNKNVLCLILIVVLAFYLRTFNVNWDSGYSFHPDERAIVMFTIPLSWPQTLNEFLSVESPLNPHFFAYGNFPIYLLKIVGEIASIINPHLNQYGEINIVGRILSSLFDVGTVIVIYFIASKIFSKTTGLFASLFYTSSVLPIQLSHFYAVDTILTFFITLTLLLSILHLKKPSIKSSIFIGVSFGFALATKVSALIFLLFIASVFVYPASSKHGGGLVKNFIFVIFFFASTITIFLITQPYVFVDFNSFMEQVALQSKMSKDAFIFPYTLQYFDKAPYLYELKNIFLWGIGPIVTVLSFLGIVIFIISLKKKNSVNIAGFLLFAALAIYFLVFGSFAVGWMRYMLPIYPLLSIFAAIPIIGILKTTIWKKHVKDKPIKKVLLYGFLILIFVYPISFLNIYTQQNTRIQASLWINKNIPLNSTLAVEHWDDLLPVMNSNNYTHMTLPLYDPDTDYKWQEINQTLERTDYIIIASNRLYSPLSRMVDCRNLPPGKCYLRTTEYYNNLFSGNLGFKKVAEFSNYPTIPFSNIPIKDDTADESFTVYDHPKVMIFKKIKSQND